MRGGGVLDSLKRLKYTAEKGMLTPKEGLFMAQEPKPSRPRAASTGQESTEPAVAPITSNTPLPPLNPLPLSEGAATDPGSPAYPSPGLMPPDVQTPPPYQPFAGPGGKPGGSGSAGERAITPVWALGSIFVIMFVSLILLVVLAVAAANVSKSPAMPIWTMIIIIIANIIYTLIAVNLSRGQGALSVPFMRPRRGP